MSNDKTSILKDNLASHTDSIPRNSPSHRSSFGYVARYDSDELRYRNNNHSSPLSEVSICYGNDSQEEMSSLAHKRVREAHFISFIPVI